MRVYGADGADGLLKLYQSGIASCEVRDIDRVRRCPFLHLPQLKMLRFLKKGFKRSKKPSPPENPPRQATDTSAGCGRNPEGGYCSRKIIPEPMGLNRAWYQITTTEGVLRSQIETGGLGINSFPHQTPQLWLPDVGVTTQVSALDCSCWGRRLFPIAPQGHGSCPETRSEQLCPNTSDLHSARRNSNWKEHEGRELSVQQPSEIAPERTFGDGQDGGDAHDIDQVRSEGCGGKSWCSCYTTVRVDHY